MRALLLFLFVFFSPLSISAMDKGSSKEPSPFALLYARHDDDRLVRLACAYALEKDSEGAFYLGAVLSEPESPYFSPQVGFLWLTLAKNWGYKFAESYTAVVFPSISDEELRESKDQISKCLESDFKICGPGPKDLRHYSLGWPPQTGFYCSRKHQK